MATINHLTLNTGNVRTSQSDEISKEIYFVLSKIKKDAAAGKEVDILDGVTMELKAEEDCYIATLYIVDKGNKIPILLTAGTKKNNKVAYITENVTLLLKRFNVP